MSRLWERSLRLRRVDYSERKGVVTWGQDGMLRQVTGETNREEHGTLSREATCKSGRLILQGIRGLQNPDDSAGKESSTTICARPANYMQFWDRRGFHGFENLCLEVCLPVRGVDDQRPFDVIHACVFPLVS